MNKLLYVITEGIGNAVLALPALEALHNAGHAVSVVGKYPALDIIPDEFRAYTLESLDTVNTPFDAVLLSPWSADYIAKYGRAPHIGECPVYEADPIDGTQHESLIHFDLAACIDGVEMPQSLSDIRLPKIPTDETGLDGVAKDVLLQCYDLESHGVGTVVLCNCAAPLWDKKRWQGYAELAHLLKDEYHIVVIGSEHDRTYNPPDAFPKDTTFLYDLPLRQVAAILDNAEWVAGNDCGLTHIASALGTKTIALFGATSIKKNAPLGVYHRTTRMIVAEMACSPCQYQQWESVCQDWECTRVITPQTVAECITSKTVNTLSLYRIKPPEQKQTLAAVIRVKDAIDTIGECLTAASRICDYFCIVDNGSTDGTLEYLHEFQRNNLDKGFSAMADMTDPPQGLGFSMGCDIDGVSSFVIQSEGYDEPRDREALDILLKNSGATWGIFLDADEIVSEQITREHVQEWMHQNTYNAIRFRHVHFWNDTEHYRTDQRWKPRHNRIMWRITPESTITTDKKIHPEIVRNLKGRVLDTDYCIKHYGHIDKRKSAERAIFYRSIDNASLPDWSGNNYTHMTDESELKLAKWDENTPIDARDFGNPSVMLVLMHGGGDMLMATPTIRALASQNPNLEISVMGLGKTQERDFKTREFFENNPCVHRYYDSSIDSHPVYWDAETFHNRDLPILHKDLERIQQLTRFDEIIITTLQSDYQKHKIDRFADACGVELSEKRTDIFEQVEHDAWGKDKIFWHHIARLERQSEGTPPLFDFLRYISIHRWCGNPNKSWDYQEYKALIERLMKDPKNVLVLWDMGDPEPSITGENIISMRDFADELTLNRSYIIMRNCELHIGADSLPMHLASATDTPTLAIFEKTLVSVAAPLNDNAVIAASVYALGHSDPDFCVEHSERIATCGLEDVKAEHLYPILHKMGYLKDDDFNWYRKTEFDFMGRTVEAPASDHNDFESPDWKELKVAKALNAYVIPNQSVFLDVGANAGRFSLLIDKCIKVGIAVEPNPEIYKMLCQNLFGFMTPEDSGLFSFYNCAFIRHRRHNRFELDGTAEWRIFDNDSRQRVSFRRG